MDEYRKPTLEEIIETRDWAQSVEQQSMVVMRRFPSVNDTRNKQARAIMVSARRLHGLMLSLAANVITDTYTEAVSKK